MSTYLITGCSSGFGRALAEEALVRGHQVVLTARKLDDIRELADAYPGTTLAVPLDVTDSASVDAAVARSLKRFGSIDVVINNAGYGFGGAVEESDRPDVDRLFETDFFGAVRVIDAVLPGMRERRSGMIVNIASIAARATSPGGGFYAAVKAALSALSGSLRKEVEALGIRVLVVQPGMFHTDFHGRSLSMATRRIADYDGVLIRDGNMPGLDKASDPRLGAKAILDVVESDMPPALLMLGKDALTYFHKNADAESADVARFAGLSESVSSTK